MVNKARMSGDLDESKEKFGNGSGIVTAVLPNRALVPMFGMEIFSNARIRRQSDGSYRLLHREVMYYTDLATGDILDHWDNIFTGERVKVVHVVNDPWNVHFKEKSRPMPSYGGLINEKEPPHAGGNHWQLLPDGLAVSVDQTNLYYPATLQPDRWPRESAGKMNRVSETFTAFVPLADLQNPRKTGLLHHGTWVRVTPWLPWMLMGQAEGHVLYNAVTFNHYEMGRAKKKVLDYTSRRHPHMLHAPMEWSEPSLSSLENYALTQKPAPPKAP